MDVCCAALMCHAPIVLPEIGGARAAECARTTRAMREIARRVVAHRPDVLVLISPHAPRQGSRWGLVEDLRIGGSFARFGFPGLRLELPGAPDAAREVRAAAERRGLRCWSAEGQDLDHGTLVPLSFLVEAGWRGATLVIALPYPGTGSEAEMGGAIREAAARRGERWAIVASGDMSHRLQPDAPAGYDPRAKEFDRAFVTALAAGDLRGACSVDPWLRELAAEDVVDSTAVAAGATGFRSDGHDILSYEGPFGVGYCEALLFTETAGRAGAGRTASSERPPAELAEIAREAIRASLLGRPQRLPRLAPPWDRPRAVFVTLRSGSGELRGCIGRTSPVLASLAEEVADCAVSAASRDPRCPPVTLDELDRLQIEVSVLGEPEPVADVGELDPRRYGVIVSRGARRGVLLPDIEGVETVSEQLAIAARKAGLAADEPLSVERFEVQKVAAGPRA